MCYLVAVYKFNGSVPYFKVFETGVAMKYRGSSATGWASITTDNEFRVKHFKGKAIDDVEVSTALLHEPRAKSIILHGRIPTTGDGDTAHPFVDYRGRFALAHNGTYYSHDEIKLLLTILGLSHVRFNVDSEVIADILSNILDTGTDFDSAVTTVLEFSWRGAILVLTSDNTLYVLVRSGDNVFCITDDGFYLASTKDGLEKLVECNKPLTLEKGIIKVRGSEIKYLVGTPVEYVETYAKYYSGYYYYKAQSSSKSLADYVRDTAKRVADALKVTTVSADELDPKQKKEEEDECLPEDFVKEYLNTYYPEGYFTEEDIKLLSCATGKDDFLKRYNLDTADYMYELWLDMLEVYYSQRRYDWGAYQ